MKIRSHGVSFGRAVREFLMDEETLCREAPLVERPPVIIPEEARTARWLIMDGERAVAWGDDPEAALASARTLSAGPFCMIPGEVG